MKPEVVPSMRIGRRLASVIRRYFWDLCSHAQASPLIPIFLRRNVLKLLLIGLGTKCFVNPHVRFTNPNVRLGDFCVIGSGAHLDGTGTLEIGNRVHIGPGTYIVSATHDIMPSPYRRDRFQINLLVTRINDGCWIGARSVIGPGVVIGMGCVIGAGSVVIRDCEPNGLYAGAPARRIRTLPTTTEFPVEHGVPLTMCAPPL